VTTQMNKSVRIVVGMDFTESGDSAMSEAVHMCARWRPAELHLTHVLKKLHHRESLHSLGRALDTKLTALETRATALIDTLNPTQHRRLSLVFHIRIGEPARALHQVAVDMEADLIVVGARIHRVGVERWLAPSVAEELIGLGHVSVVVACAPGLASLAKSAHPDPRRDDPNVMPHHPMHHVHLEMVDRKTHISGLI
jgi:nucleotide-binding universal stress UspA family protein